jgi:hypothetical protein
LRNDLAQGKGLPREGHGTIEWRAGSRYTSEVGGIGDDAVNDVTRKANRYERGLVVPRSLTDDGYQLIGVARGGSSAAAGRSQLTIISEGLPFDRSRADVNGESDGHECKVRGSVSRPRSTILGR